MSLLGSLGHPSAVSSSPLKISRGAAKLAQTGMAIIATILIILNKRFMRWSFYVSGETDFAVRALRPRY